MRLHIYTPWRNTEAEAKADREFLKKKFNLQANHGWESIRLTDTMEHRADCTIDSDDVDLK